MKLTTIVLAATLAIAGNADDGVAYSTLGPDGGFSTSSSWRISDPGAPSGPAAAYELAVPFTPKITGQLKMVEVPIARVSTGSGIGSARTISIHAGSPTSSSAILERFELWPTAMAQGIALKGLVSTNRPQLHVGTNYWLVFQINPTGTSSDYVYLSSPKVSGLMRYRRSVASAYAEFGGTLPAMRITLGEADAPVVSTNGPAGPMEELIAALQTALSIARKLNLGMER